LVIVAALAVGATAADAAEEPTLEEYVARVEPICQADTEASHHILSGAQAKVDNGKLKSAGAQFATAAIEFGNTIKKLKTVSRPPAYETKLTKWFSHLQIIDTYLRKIATALKGGDKLRATYEVVKLRGSANAANNVVYDLGFHYCRITAKRFK
jgi:hypothetical protein